MSQWTFFKKNTVHLSAATFIMNDQLNRIEEKLDDLIVTVTTNKVELSNHKTIDKSVYKVVFGIVLFIVVTHTSDVAAFVKLIFQ